MQTRPRICWSDTETYSEVPITNGTYAYAEKAEVMLWAFAFDDGPVWVWDRTSGLPIPAALKHAIEDENCIFVFHNAQFDRTVLRENGFDIPLERIRCTMVKALSHSLPGSLDALCDIMQVPVDKAKDKAGRQLIQLFCKPRPANNKIHRATSETHPAEWQQFIAYAKSDIEAMRVIDKKLPAWNYRDAELALWHLDQRINERGVLMDVDLAGAAITAVDAEQKKLAKRTQDLTDGAVQAATQRDALLRHLVGEYGIDLPDMQQATLEKRIDDPDLPIELRELLGIRLQASTTSTAKYKRLMRGVNSDSRLRGTLQFNGASRTGRWAGRLFQPQNLPRPSLKQGEINAGIEALKAGCADLVFNNVMELTSSTIRGCIIAPPGKKLVVADLSNIEGRDQAWLAGERWKLDAFRAFDAGTGHDLYKLAYAKSFGVKPEDVDKDQRQVGKVQELALGYEGGVGAFLTFAEVYRIDLDKMAEDAFAALPADVLEDASDSYAWTVKNKRPTFGLAPRTWIVCKAFTQSWRTAHSSIRSMWDGLDRAVRDAIDAPGLTFPVRMLKVRRDGSWLRIKLPSGRFLCYPMPKIEENKISYMGINQYSRKWSRLNTYGGKLFENVCQAVARDVMAHNMPAIEATGYRIVLTVHDEVITEAPDTDEYSAEHLSALLSANPPWAPDMPLAAGGFEAYRYRKD